MRNVLLLGIVSAMFGLAGSTLASDENVAGDPWPAPAGFVAAPCTDDTYCGVQALDAGYVADGEWNSATNQNGFVTSNNYIAVIGAVCASISFTEITGGDFPDQIPRSFAWGMNNDAWVGTWYSAPTLPKLHHLDSNFNVIASYAYPDPLTGLDMQLRDWRWIPPTATCGASCAITPPAPSHASSSST